MLALSLTHGAVGAQPFPGLVSGTMNRLFPKLLTAAPSLLPEHERWARAFRVWRSLCNHSWYPQSDEIHLLLLQILHLLLMSNRISHNFGKNKLEVYEQNFCTRMGLSFLMKHIFTGLPVLRFSSTAL